MTKTVLASLIVALLISVASADDWPQWRGPERTGVSREKGLLRSWPKDGPKLAWTFRDAGLGYSSVAVAKGVVYTLGSNTTLTDEVIIALDEKTGKELWQTKIGPLFTFKGNSWGDGPRSTPTVDGNFLYALGGHGDLVCVDVSKKGGEVWRKNLKRDLAGEMMTEWGFSESPLVDGNQLICSPGGSDGLLAAFNKRTGEVVWRTRSWREKAPYSSAVVAEIHGVRQYLQAGYSGGKQGASLAGVEAKTGKVLWSTQLFSGDSYSISPTPIVIENKVYVTNSNGCHLFAIDAKQNVTDLFSKKTHRRVKNNHGGVVYLKGHIYGHSDPQSWICQDIKTGEDTWIERVMLPCASGAIVASQDSIILFTDDGDVGLAAATNEFFKLVSSFSLPEKSKIANTRPSSRQGRLWTHPVIANGYLILRDNELIFAYDVSDKR